MSRRAYFHSPSGRRALVALVCWIGSTLSLLVYAYFQEKILSTPYEHHGQYEYFADTSLLIFANRLLATLLLSLIAWWRGQWRQTVRPVAPPWRHALVTLSWLLASVCQYESLKWMSMPTQLLIKCIKSVPLLLIARVAYGKPSDWIEYAAAAGMLLGCTLFVTTGTVHSARWAQHTTDATETLGGMAILLGGGLLAAFLLFDSYTAASQEQLFHAYGPQLSMMNMHWQNSVLACLLLAGTRLLATPAAGTALDGVRYCWRHPRVLLDAWWLSLSGLVGQMCILLTLREFGALYLTAMTAVRQFASLMISNTAFRHQMSPMQWLGAALVFGSALPLNAVRQRRREVKAAHGHENA